VSRSACRDVRRAARVERAVGRVCVCRVWRLVVRVWRVGGSELVRRVVGVGVGIVVLEGARVRVESWSLMLCSSAVRADSTPVRAFCSLLRRSRSCWLFV